jgi:hypothetical protein
MITDGWYRLLPEGVPSKDSDWNGASMSAAL